MKTVGNAQFVSISKAKTRLPELAGADKPTVLLRQNEPVAALVSIDRYNDYLALEKLIRNPALFDQLRQKAKAARTVPIQKLQELEEFERSRQPESRPAGRVKAKTRAR